MLANWVAPQDMGDNSDSPSQARFSPQGTITAHGERAGQGCGGDLTYLPMNCGIKRPANRCDAILWGRFKTSDLIFPVLPKNLVDAPISVYAASR